MISTRDRLSKSYVGMLIVALCALAIASDLSPCQELSRRKNKPQRTVSILGRECLISVYWDGSEPSQAAAALLLVVLKHGLGYQLLDMNLVEHGPCSLQEERERLTRDEDWPEKVIIAPSIAWDESAANRCNTNITSDRLQVIGPGVVRVSLKPQDRYLNPDLDTISTIRVADVSILRQFAPSLLEIFGKFFPEPNVIPDVLKWKSNHPNANIIEAACSWALNNSQEFEEFLEIKRKRVYEMVVFLCQDDPEHAIYESVLINIFKILNSSYQNVASRFNTGLKLRHLDVDCTDEYSLMRKFMERAQSVYFPRLIGAVASGTGTRAAANVASALDTPLVLYDIPAESDGGPLQRGARSATGRLQHLSLAFQYFLTTCQWSRLAIISEETKVASDFVRTLRTVKNLTVKDVTIKAGVKTALRTLYEKDARIIFINGNANVAISVLCAAHELKILDDNSIVWILHEWRSEDLKCANTTISPDIFSHFTISFWWRGGNTTTLNLKPNQYSLHEILDDLSNKQAWPLRTAPLVDAMTMLLNGFYNLLQNQPQSVDDLHSENTYRAFWSSYESKPPLGTTQQLRLSQQTLSDPNIYIYKWCGKQKELKAVWQIYNDSVQVIRQNTFFDQKTPSDGRQSCRTVIVGDNFSPHCHDAACFTALVTIIIAIPAVLLARRTRLEHIARRDRVLTARLLARGRRASAALAAHLVDRATLQIGRQLGAGRFGRVDHAILRPPGKPSLVVAVKALREEATQAEEREFLNEAVILASLSHQYIVRLIGVCATGGPPLVLMEHAFFGDLLKYLRERRYLVEAKGEISAEAEHVSAPALTRLAHQAATALDYLRQQRLVHRDVRASNCLVDTRRSLKLADFGLARKMETGTAGGDEEYLGRRRGLLPALWMAPESLECGIFSASSDVWALGVLLLELTTLGTRPYGNWPPERVISYVCAGGYPPLPMDVTPNLRRLLMQCWQRIPTERISAAKLAHELMLYPTVLQTALQPPDVAIIQMSKCHYRSKSQFEIDN